MSSGVFIVGDDRLGLGPSMSPQKNQPLDADMTSAGLTNKLCFCRPSHTFPSSLNLRSEDAFLKMRAFGRWSSYLSTLESESQDSKSCARNGALSEVADESKFGCPGRTGTATDPNYTCHT